MKIVDRIKNHLKFIDTLTTKLLTLVLFITVIPLMVVGNFSTSIINQNMVDSTRSELGYSSLLSKQKYQDRLDALKLLTTHTAKLHLNNSYKEYMASGNKKVLLEDLSSFINDFEIDLALIIEKSNFLIKYDKSNSLQKLINLAFEGKVNASTEIIPNLESIPGINKGIFSKNDNYLGLSQIAVSPIFNDKKQIVAVLLVSKSLKDSGKIPYAIKALSGASLTMYQVLDNKPEIITTNVDLPDKAKSEKELVNNDFFSHIKSGELYFASIQQPNRLEMGQYEAIKNFSGEIIAAMYLGIAEYKFSNSGSNNVKLISLISVMSLIVAIVIAALFARTITTPLLKLVIAAKSIASGYLHQRVKIRGNDEIAQLATAFNQMADNLQQQEQLRDNFVATLTHDLKVPMLAENQTINYVLKEAYGPITEEQKEVLDLIKSTNNSSLEMVSTLLEVYRYDSGNADLIKSEFDIVKLAKNSIDQIKSLAQDKKITISLESNKDSILVLADEREIKRVLHNLISNAITNGIHRGQIICSIEYVGDKKTLYDPKAGIDEYTTLRKPVNISNTVIVSVKDDGIGIAREEIEELFKRFSFSKGRKPAGTGLGLYYTYQVITKHKGCVWAETVEGKGSTFKFTIPVEI
ncbi:MAG: Sensor protein [uncultured bacterium]|nr:MAG: Sensor protein [uncultured bacterium]